MAPTKFHHVRQKGVDLMPSLFLRAAARNKKGRAKKLSPVFLNVFSRKDYASQIMSATALTAEVMKIIAQTQAKMDL